MKFSTSSDPQHTQLFLSIRRAEKLHSLFKKVQKNLATPSQSILVNAEETRHLKDSKAITLIGRVAVFFRSRELSLLMS